MLEKLQQIEEKYSDIQRRMQEPEVYSDMALYTRLAKEQKELQPIVDVYRRWKKFKADADEAQELLSDH